MSNDEIIIAPKGRLTFGRLFHSPAQRDSGLVVEDIHTVDGNTIRAPIRYEPLFKSEVDGDDIPLIRMRETTYRTEFKLHPHQAEAAKKITETAREFVRAAMEKAIGDIFVVPAKYYGETVNSTTAAEVLMRTQEFEAAVKKQDAPGYMSARIIYSKAATKPTSERLFPFSPHRSMRIHKKLIKRFGGVYRHEPAIYQLKGMIIAHPSFREKIEAALVANSKGQNG